MADEPVLPSATPRRRGRIEAALRRLRPRPAEPARDGASPHALRRELVDAALGNMSQGLCMWDAEHRIVLCNRRYRDIYGFPARVVREGASMRDVFALVVELGLKTDATPAELFEAFKARLAPGRPFTFVQHLKRADAGPRVVEITHEPMAGGGWVATYTDITDRELAANRLSESEARHRLLADHASDLIVLGTLEGKRVYASPACRALLGYEPEEFLAGHLSDFIHPDDIANVREATVSLVHGAPSVQLEYRMLRRDGSELWVDTVFKRFGSLDGKTFGVIAAIRDASARRAAAAELAAQARTLETTLAAMHQGLMMIDAGGRVQVCNPRAIELLGLPAALMAARPLFADVLRMQLESDEFDNAGEAFRAWVESGGLAGSPESYERERPDGTILEIRTTLLPDGGAVRTYTDVTERRRAEARLAAAEGEYRALFENAVVGIYRSTPDGRQLRANPALLKLNGYKSEAEQIRLGRDTASEWYAEPGRRAEFVRRMTADGRVTDFVSEIIGYGSRKRIWVAETAWAVRNEAGEVVAYEGMVIDATDRILAERQVAHMARHDALTGLPNRVAFNERLAAALAESAAGGDAARDVRAGETAAGGATAASRVAVLCVDLDRFKSVNDTLGHPAGDALLVAVGARLRAVTREADLVARLGGDEFAVVAPTAALPAASEGPDPAERRGRRPVPSAEECAVALAERIVAALKEPFALDVASGRHLVEIGASVGVALAPKALTLPSPGAGDAHADALAEVSDRLLRDADFALYAAKAAGRNAVRLFTPGVDAPARRRQALEADLRLALARGEFELHHQPIIDLHTGATVRTEALVRWNHPRRGLLMPGEFIAVAESCGLIGPIGDWILREACRQAASWPEGVSVAVNVSAQQFGGLELVAAVASALAAARLPASRLELEVTETALLRDDDEVLSTLRRLRALGVRIALDDFGTGYSSLGYLRRFPFDKIKIDRTFVADAGNPASVAVVRAVAGLGRLLDVAVVAEGVETATQLNFVRAEGCLEAQGYHIGRPVPFAAMRAALAAAPASPPGQVSPGQVSLGQVSPGQGSLGQAEAAPDRRIA